MPKGRRGEKRPADVIEVDGAQHDDERQAEHDAIRDRILRREGFQVLRLWTGDVRRDADLVTEQIVAALEAAAPTHGGGRKADAVLEPDVPSASRSVPPH